MKEKNTSEKLYLILLLVGIVFLSPVIIALILPVLIIGFALKVIIDTAGWIQASDFDK